MIGIVLVSHSAKLAEGVKEIASQMANGVLIEAAGGLDDFENSLGTDAMKIMAAIESVYQDDDVLVLMDLGSALINAQTAIEFLDEKIQQRVHLCSAPLVEGGIAAAVQAMIGSPIEEVIAEAKKSLDSKMQLLSEESIIDIKFDTEAEESGFSFDIKVPNAYGLHARPASKMVYLAKGLDLEAKVSVDNKQWHNAKSINNLSLLGAKKDDTLYFRLKGSDAELFKEKIQQFQKENFGDELDFEIPNETETTLPDGAWGIPSSPGIGIGKATVVRYKPFVLEKVYCDSPSKERVRFLKGLDMAHREIEGNKRRLSSVLSNKDIEIFDAHIAFLEDIELQNLIFNQIETEKVTLEKAWWDQTQVIISRFEKSSNLYIKQRATDIRDIQSLLLRQISDNVPELECDFSEPVVVMLDNIQPSDVLKLDPEKVKGILLAEGNENAHTSILARSLGIPAITAMKDNLSKIKEGEMIIIDGRSGKVLLDQKSQEWKELKQEKENTEAEKERLVKEAQEKVSTKSGISVEVLANVTGFKDAHTALQNGADGVGLFRTELYFMQKKQAPTQEDQIKLYTEMASLFDTKPFTIRTLDIGGDKPIPYLPMDKEENPFLGVRGVRYCLSNQEIFKTQLKAILQAAYLCPNIQVMYPMISTLQELEMVKKLLKDCKNELLKEAKPFKIDLSEGMMVEVPSAVLLAKKFAKHVDFFSIGTNDLAQYLLAADRGNAKVKSLISSDDASVLNAIEMVVKAAKDQEIPVSICGEIASNNEIIPKLIKLGIKKLSVNAVQVPYTKQEIKNTN